MAEHVDSAEDTLPEANGLDLDSAEPGQVSASAGTFALRRARYFNEIIREPLSDAEQQRTPTGFIGRGDLDAKQETEQ